MERDVEFPHVGDAELEEATKAELREVTRGFFDRPIERAEDFDWESFKRNEAFKAIMMPSRLFWVLGSFERSFTQKLGQQMYEEFGRAVADANHAVGDADTQHAVDLEVTPAEQGVIESIVGGLDGGARDPDWEAEAAAVRAADQTRERRPAHVNWDLWVEEFRDGRPLATEIKTPKPNKDQTMESKRQMLKTVAGYKHREEPEPIVRYVFPFNPYGDPEEYAHWPPQKIFDVRSSDGMLIAEEFWDAVGGPGTMDGLFNFLLEESTGNIETLRRLAGGSEL